MSMPSLQLTANIRRSWPGPSATFDLEDPGDLASLADPMLTLRPLRGLVVLEEI
jgi:hypothetical protein